MENSASRKMRAYKILFVSLVILSLFQFLLYYVTYGFFYESSALVYTESLVTHFADGLFPIIAALATTLAFSKIRAKILFSILISLSKIAYSLPYYYLYFLSDVYDSLESILLGFGVSILLALGIGIEVFLLSLLMGFPKCREKEPCESGESFGIFNFNNSSNFGIVLAVLLTLTVSFVREIIDIISFLLETPSITGKEVISLVSSPMILIISSIIYYIISAAICRKACISKKQTESESDSQ